MLPGGGGEVEPPWVYLLIDFSVNVHQGPIVPEGSPLGAVAHPTLVNPPLVLVPHFLHVADIGASANEEADFALLVMISTSHHDGHSVVH